VVERSLEARGRYAASARDGRTYRAPQGARARGAASRHPLRVEGLRAFNLLRTSLPEREYIGFDPACEKGDLKGASIDRSELPDQLVKPRLDKRSVPLVVDVEPMGGSRRNAVEEHAERHGRIGGPRSQDEVDVAGVEAERDPSAGLVENTRPSLDRPLS
jgi:hypothetical protein